MRRLLGWLACLVGFHAPARSPSSGRLICRRCALSLDAVELDPDQGFDGSPLDGGTPR